jgi:hypothetical protein
MSVARLREMFARMVVAADASVVPAYYHPDFLLTTNGRTEGYADFLASHERVYGDGVRYAVEYDEDAWVEAPDRVAGRVFITLERPGEAPVRIEVVLIARFRDGLIHRLWELTWPDWSRLGALEAYGA